VEREGAGYRVGVRAVDAYTGQRILEEATDVGDKEKALSGVAKLAARLRIKLGDATPEGVQVKEAATYGAASLEAAHEYAVGAALSLSGKTDEAKARYLESLKLDPDMSRALAGLGAIEANRGRRAEAEKYLKEAIARVGRMSERERYRTQGIYDLIAHDIDGAIETYRTLVKQFPADNVALSNLGMAYAMKHDFKSSLDVLRKSSAIYPNNVITRHNVGLAALFVGDLEGAIREQEKVLETSATFTNGYIGLALAQLAAGKHDAALATWQKLQQRGGDREAAALEGLADLAMYDGRLSDARKLLEEGIQADLSRKDGDTAARKLAMLAELHLTLHQPRPALAAAERALKLSHDEAVVFTVAQVYALEGDEKRAQALASELDGRIAADARMYAELVRGAIELRRGNHGEAIARFRSAVQRLDAWVARYALGRAYVEAGAFPQAIDELERCSKRHGEAADAFQATAPTYRFYPRAQYYLARAYEGVKSPAAAEKYQAFLALKKTSEDPLVNDARARLERLTATASGK
jgi:tetratricopeptide (TPR) repeat protein